MDFLQCKQGHNRVQVFLQLHRKPNGPACEMDATVLAIPNVQGDLWSYTSVRIPNSELFVCIVLICKVQEFCYTFSKTKPNTKNLPDGSVLVKV